VSEALQRGVSVRSGSEFGALGASYLAVSFAIGGDQLAKGLKRLTNALRAFSDDDPQEDNR
jgi:bifunctional pyridoxal-dependent enzyme with beta-cystathionase and maltose regulon repressor activities